MAETVSIRGQEYLKRTPLGVLGLSFITFGIYGLYWYYKANEEIKRYTGDETISPTRSLLALVPGAFVIVPPIIAFYNTANHVAEMERERRISSEISPALTIVLALFVSIAIGPYVQEHMNRVWDAATSSSDGTATAPSPPPPPMPMG